MSGAVVVVGSINVDLVLGLPALPGPGETVVATAVRQSGGGKGANQAVAAASLGAPTYLVGCLGDDASGSATAEDLAAAGVDLSGVRVVQGATGVAVVLVDPAGENSIAVASGANATLSADMVDETLADLAASALARADRVVLLASLEIPLPAVQRAESFAVDHGWTVVLNPAPAVPLPTELIAACDVLTPNHHEVVRLGQPSVQDLHRAGAAAVVVTRGGAGADLYPRSGSPAHFDVPDVDVVDTTGAGDCFSGALAAALAAGASLPIAVEIAVVAGTLATRGHGARGALPDLDAVRKVAPAAIAAMPGWS